MDRPLIGITTHLEPARWGSWIREATLSPVAYARDVTRAGGAPVLVPPLRQDLIDDYIAGLDGLILTGGASVDPAWYGEERHPGTAEPQPHRDRFEIALARAAVEANLPLLATGRGMHVLNVARGGTLIQWLPDVVGHSAHSPNGGTATHPVQLSRTSRLGKTLGDEVVAPADHSQAVRRLGKGLLAVAWADDQVVEGVELQGHQFGIGVQWDLERGDDLRLYQALVAAASRPA